MIGEMGVRVMAGFVILFVAAAAALMVGGLVVVAAGLFTKHGGDLKQPAVVKAVLFWIAVVILAWLVGGLAT